MPRTTLPAIAAAILALGLSSCDGSSAGDTASPSPKSSNASGDLGKGGGQLFVATAVDGRVKAGAKPHQFVLTLSRVSGSVAVFTDRPERRAGSEPIDDFVDSWGSLGFKETPPNAAVVWAQDGRSRIFELSEPAYDAKADTLTFAAADLGDKASTALSNFEALASQDSDAKLARRSGEVSVFIDNASDGSDETGDFWAMQGPAGASATITFDKHTVTGFRTVNARGNGSGGSSAREINLTCVEKPCWIIAEFTLSPGTVPITGVLELDGGAKVDHPAMDGSTQIHKQIPAGPFSVTPVQ